VADIFDSENDPMKIISLSGQMLLATPNMLDLHFKDSVVLLCHHDEEGSMGLIINRPQRISIHDVLADVGIAVNPDAFKGLPEYRICSYEGGPMDAFRGFVLHDSWYVYDSTMQVSDDIHLSTSRDVLEHIAEGTGPEHFMLVLGYAGWGAGQLEQELLENSWIVCGVNQQLLFHTEPESRWAQAARSMGIDKAHLSTQAGHA